MKPFRLWRGIRLLQRARWHMRRADKLMSRIEGLQLHPGLSSGATCDTCALEGMGVTPTPGVAKAILAHLSAVDIDEITYDRIAAAIGGKAKKAAKAAASLTLADEIAAFQRFVAEPCRSAADVQAKVEYVLIGTVGDRDKLFDNLLSGPYCPDDGPLLNEVFLRSLVLDDASRAPHATQACACEHARGATIDRLRAQHESVGVTPALREAYGQYRAIVDTAAQRHVEGTANG